MSKSSKTIVISLGGSIVVPKAGEVNFIFLKAFRKLILEFIKKGFKFIIIVGGGKTCRLYQTAASEVSKVSDGDKDWLGIHTTRLNAHLLRTIFRDAAYPVILDDPRKPVKNNWKLLIASGWRPGNSTDYIATLLAKRFKIKEIINAGDVPFAYDKDPRIHKNARAFKEISWENFRKIVGSRWTPGLSAPFDPVASKLSQKLKIRVFIIKGTEIENFRNLLLRKGFRGTLIKP